MAPDYCCGQRTLQNRNSDFVLLERFTVKGQPAPVDAFNWRIEYYTSPSDKVVVSFKDGVFSGCVKNDDSSILVIFNSPGFSCGDLLRTAYLDYPNALFDDGIEHIEIPADTGVTITGGASSTQGRITSSVVLDYVEGKQGVPGAKGDSQWVELRGDRENPIRVYELESGFYLVPPDQMLHFNPDGSSQGSESFPMVMPVYKSPGGDTHATMFGPTYTLRVSYIAKTDTIEIYTYNQTQSE